MRIAHVGSTILSRVFYPLSAQSSPLAYAIVLLFLLSDLSATESSTDSPLIWLFSLLALLAAML